MASIENVRAVALILQQCVEALYTDIISVYGVTSGWNVTGLDEDLPPEGDVKSILGEYEQISKFPVNLASAVRDVKESTEAVVEGLFFLPTTVYPLVFRIEGPVIPGVFDTQSFGTDLEIEKITVFCKDTGTGGNNLVLDVMLNSNSIFANLPLIPANSGNNVLYIVPDEDISETSILSADVLEAITAFAPDGCRDVTLTIWVRAV